MPTKFIYPIEYNIQIKQLGEDKWELKYIEKFKPEDIKAFENAAELIKTPSLPIILNKEKSQAELHIITIKKQVFNLIAAEFIFVGGVAEMTIGDLFKFALQGITKNKKETL